MKRMLIGIPAYNEQKTIKSVITSAQSLKETRIHIDIVVVDDGSRDATSSIASDMGVFVAKHVINRGLGGSLRTIFAFARSRRYDFLVTMDADGQHQATDIPRLISPLIRGYADVVIGTRWLYPKKAPKKRVLVNKIANIVTYLFFGIHTSDSQSGFRAFNKTAIERIRLNADGMEVSSEFFHDIFTHKLRYAEVPIDPIYTKYSQKKGQQLSNIPSVLFELVMTFLRQ